MAPVDFPGESGGAIVLEGDALKRAPTTEVDADGETSCTEVARVRTLAIFSCARRIGSDIPERTGRWRAAPAEARKAFGEKGLAVPDWPDAAVIAPVAPKAAAVRRMVPTFPGS